ncbi:MAG: hypothetical protein ACXAD7_18660 [Candidatus Kariarchaeaceae archaeon]|jgi:hypothetical protein
MSDKLPGIDELKDAKKKLDHTETEERTQSLDLQIGDAKEKLEHVEPKESAVNPVFLCSVCGHKADIPVDIVNKLEDLSEEEISTHLPDHCGQKMKISVES